MSVFRHRDVISLNKIVVFEGLKSVFTPNFRQLVIREPSFQLEMFTWKCHEVIFLHLGSVLDRITNALGGD